MDIDTILNRNQHPNTRYNVKFKPTELVPDPDNTPADAAEGKRVGLPYQITLNNEKLRLFVLTNSDDTEVIHAFEYRDGSNVPKLFSAATNINIAQSRMIAQLRKVGLC